MKALAPLALVLALAGCSDPQPSDRTLEGELTDTDRQYPQDQSYYDEYTVEAGEGWTITVEMRSTAFDTFLWLRTPSGEAAQNDDTPGMGRDSRIEHFTTERGTYTVWANSYDGTGRGPYTLRIVAEPGNTPAPRSPNPTPLPTVEPPAAAPAAPPPSSGNGPAPTDAPAAAPSGEAPTEAPAGEAPAPAAAPAGEAPSEPAAGEAAPTAN
jgi:hypothetical protein